MTSHIVSLWTVNSSFHQRYDVNIYLNSGQNLDFYRDEIDIPRGEYTIKIVTDKGNQAVFSGS